MPRPLPVFALALLLLGGCAGVSVQGPVPPLGQGKLKDEKKLPSPEADPKAPGMIPPECEALLNNAKAWGVNPAEDWRPANTAAAVEAMRFFAGFHLIPESTSDFARAWLQEPPPRTDAAATRSLEKMDRAQSCDLLLSHRILRALIAYRWPLEYRREAGASLLGFVRAQQERALSTMARAIQLDVLIEASRHDLVAVPEIEAVKDLRSWFDAAMQKGLAEAQKTKNPRETWELNRRELHLSEECWKRLNPLLP